MIIKVREIAINVIDYEHVYNQFIILNQIIVKVMMSKFLRENAATALYEGG